MTIIDDYFNNLDPPQKAELERMRKIIKEQVPEAEEMISYGMPTFKYKKRPLIYLGAFKNHMSIFPASAQVVKQLGKKAEKYHTSKGTLQFTLDNPISDSLLKEIIEIRKEEINLKAPA